MKDINQIPILEIENLSISFHMYNKGMKKHKLEMIHKLSLTISSGEIVVVVGSSGSGKSLLAHSILGILPQNAEIEGTIKFCGKEMGTLEKENLRGKEISFIPQSVEYLDPLMKIGKQLFRRYQLEESVAKLYPYQLSGGMARRVLISGAMMRPAKLIIADEPTPGLQKELAMETLKNFRELADSGCAVLLITHDIDLALQVADQIAIFYFGTILEITSVEDFMGEGKSLRHPYSKAFLAALPQKEFQSIEGSQPYAGNLPKGCLFAKRCPNRTEACEGEIEMRSLRGGKVRCIYAE